ncbi:unnamed protein product, partial [Chrysoparadoxa australica]
DREGDGTKQRKSRGHRSHKERGRKSARSNPENPPGGILPPKPRGAPPDHVRRNGKKDAPTKASVTSPVSGSEGKGDAGRDLEGKDTWARQVKGRGTRREKERSPAFEPPAPSSTEASRRSRRPASLELENDLDGKETGRKKRNENRRRERKGYSKKGARHLDTGSGNDADDTASPVQSPGRGPVEAAFLNRYIKAHSYRNSKLGSGEEAYDSIESERSNRSSKHRGSRKKDKRRDYHDPTAHGSAQSSATGWDADASQCNSSAQRAAIRAKAIEPTSSPRLPEQDGVEYENPELVFSDGPSSESDLDDTERLGSNLCQKSRFYEEDSDEDATDLPGKGRGSDASGGRDVTKRADTSRNVRSLEASQSLELGELGDSTSSSRPQNPLMICHGGEFGAKLMQQCVIIRERGGLHRLYPCYKLYFQDKDKLMMVGQKQGKNRTSNYHIFDMHRGMLGHKLSKKNGNYMGKVRANFKRTELTLYTNDEEKEELGAIVYDRQGIVGSLKEGSLPRCFHILLPPVGADNTPIPRKVDPFAQNTSMIELLKAGRTGNMFLLQTKEPLFDSGNYRLNFKGRVTVPSVKNFQLVSPDDINHIVCQFGKVGEDRFNLDYRAPLNAFQAFGIAMSTFNF